MRREPPSTVTAASPYGEHQAQRRRVRSSKSFSDPNSHPHREPSQNVESCRPGPAFDSTRAEQGRSRSGGRPRRAISRSGSTVVSSKGFKSITWTATAAAAIPVIFEERVEVGPNSTPKTPKRWEEDDFVDSFNPPEREERIAPAVVPITRRKVNPSRYSRSPAPVEKPWVGVQGARLGKYQEEWEGDEDGLCEPITLERSLSDTSIGSLVGARFVSPGTVPSFPGAIGEEVGYGTEVPRWTSYDVQPIDHSDRGSSTDPDSTLPPPSGLGNHFESLVLEEASATKGDEEEATTSEPSPSTPVGPGTRSKVFAVAVKPVERTANSINYSTREDVTAEVERRSAEVKAIEVKGILDGKFSTATQDVISRERCMSETSLHDSPFLTKEITKEITQDNLERLCESESNKIAALRRLNAVAGGRKGLGVAKHKRAGGGKKGTTRKYLRYDRDGESFSWTATRPPFSRTTVDLKDVESTSRERCTVTVVIRGKHPVQFGTDSLTEAIILEAGLRVAAEQASSSQPVASDIPPHQSRPNSLPTSHRYPEESSVREPATKMGFRPFNRSMSLAPKEYSTREVAARTDSCPFDRSMSLAPEEYSARKPAAGSDSRPFDQSMPLAPAPAPAPAAAAAAPLKVAHPAPTAPGTESQSLSAHGEHSSPGLSAHHPEHHGGVHEGAGVTPPAGEEGQDSTGSGISVAAPVTRPPLPPALHQESQVLCPRVRPKSEGARLARWGKEAQGLGHTSCPLDTEVELGESSHESRRSRDARVRSFGSPPLTPPLPAADETIQVNPTQSTSSLLADPQPAGKGEGVGAGEDNEGSQKSGRREDVSLQPEDTSALRQLCQAAPCRGKGLVVFLVKPAGGRGPRRTFRFDGNIGVMSWASKLPPYQRTRVLAKDMMGATRDAREVTLTIRNRNPVSFETENLTDAIILENGANAIARVAFR
ncbi:unnamed protein product [Discosporangium mesarthrocarpum]